MPWLILASRPPAANRPDFPFFPHATSRGAKRFSGSCTRPGMLARLPRDQRFVLRCGGANGFASGGARNRTCETNRLRLKTVAHSVQVAKMSTIDSFGKCALLVAHPGHEIHVHGWLEKTRPVVYVLTDGSGRSGHARLASTTQLLARSGARPGAIYGRLTDRALYNAVLRRDIALFRNLAAELADEMVRERCDVGLGDAAEGEILAPDVWR